MSEGQSRQHLRDELSGGVKPPPQLAKAPEVEIEQPKLRTLKHHDMCPGLRGMECNCAANLKLIEAGELKALETKTCRWTEHEKIKEERDSAGRITRQAEVRPHIFSADIIRVDAGKTITVSKPHPSGSRTQAPLRVEQQLDPRWVCTKCGWGGRGRDVSHRCDKAAVALATRRASLADGLTQEQLTSGAFRLVIWRDKDGVYVLAEELVIEGKIFSTIELDRDVAYGVLEGALLAATVDRWS